MSHRSEWLPSKSLQTTNAGEGVEKRGTLLHCWWECKHIHHYGEQCGDSLKNWKKNCHMTQKSHCWAYTPRKPELKETRVPNIHRSTVYHSQDMEAT